MTTRILLVRHGAVSYSGRVGDADDRLNTLGELQTQALARRLVERTIAAVYTSPLQRAVHTAAILSQFLGVAVKEEPRLLELNPGEWRGLQEGEAQARFPDDWRRAREDPAFVIPGGETREALRKRAVAAAEAIAFAHPGQEVVAVSHGGALSALIGYFLGLEPHAGDWPFELDHCSISVLEFEGESATLRGLNDTAHLEGLAL